MARRGQDNVTVRMAHDLWERFGELAEPDRSAVLRDFVRWYAGEAGAKMPKRPTGPQRPRGPWEPVSRSASVDQSDEAPRSTP